MMNLNLSVAEVLTTELSKAFGRRPVEPEIIKSA